MNSSIADANLAHAYAMCRLDVEGDGIEREAREIIGILSVHGRNLAGQKYNTGDRFRRDDSHFGIAKKNKRGK